MEQPPAPDEKPTPPEMTAQLERVLASEIFRRASKPAQLLRVIAERAIDGKDPLNEYALGVDVFGRKENWIKADDRIVSENFRRLRSNLDRYYATEGIPDRVVIEIAKSSYTPTFGYNPRGHFEMLYRRAMDCMGTNPGRAHSLLQSALELEPRHAGAHVAMVETEIWWLLYGRDTVDPDLIDRMQSAAFEALHADDKHWRAHLVIGALYSCRRDWENAQAAFVSALKLSSGVSETHPFYCAFLMAIGKTEESLQLVQSRASANPVDAWAQLSYVLFLYVAGKFDAADRALSLHLSASDGDLWLERLLLNRLHAIRKPARKVIVADLSTTPRLRDGTSIFPALELLDTFADRTSEDQFSSLFRTSAGFLPREPPAGLEDAYLVHRVSHEDLDKEVVRREVIELVRKDLALWERSTAAVQTADDSRDSWSDKVNLDGQLIFPPRCSPCQLAVGYLAIGEVDKAVELLSRDLDNNHPLLVWLHLWPEFHCLRDDNRFQTLLSRMNLDFGQRRPNAH